jgi:hypothetical protein
MIGWPGEDEEPEELQTLWSLVSSRGMKGTMATMMMTIGMTKMMMTETTKN